MQDKEILLHLVNLITVLYYDKHLNDKNNNIYRSKSYQENLNILDEIKTQLQNK